MTLLYGAMDEGSLAFLPSPLSLEPSEQRNIVARDFCAVSPNLLLAGYHESTSRRRQATVLRSVSLHDAYTGRRLSASPRTELSAVGTTPVLQTICEPFVTKTGRKLVSAVVLSYPQDMTTGHSSVTVTACALDAETGEPVVATTGKNAGKACQETTGIVSKALQLREIQLESLGKGRLLMVYTDATKAVYVRMLGAFNGEILA